MRYWKFWMTFALGVLAVSAEKGDDVERVDEGDVKGENEANMKHLVRDFMDTNPETVNGEPLLEGDILLTEEQWRAVRERKGLASLASRWPVGLSGSPVVPYIFTDSRLNTTIINAAINHWQQHTCITFQQTTNTNQPHLRFIYGNGCYSSMGILMQNGQDISIGQGCDTLGIAAHEIGHAIGFVHEQSRPDRDNYVVINSGNIYPSTANNFLSFPTSFVNTQNILYDFSSDMHYASTAFSINGQTTVATKDPLAQGIIGQRTGLSHRDKRLANIMYNCTGKWLVKCKKTSDPCLNEGYLGAACTCVCPPGTTGQFCGTRTAGYYDSLKNPCTKNITTAGTITSPNYPNPYSPVQCVTWIQAPKCNLPKLTFKDFSLYGRNSYCSGGNSCCYFDGLEIRTNSLYNGTVYCGTDIAPNTTFTGTSRDIVLYFKASSWWLKGYSATLDFVPQKGCTATT